MNCAGITRFAARITARSDKANRNRQRFGNRPFDCTVDLFDAERDVYPYPDGHFETVLACELIEHMIYDPMHLLLECRRVLEDGGRLLLTTPNIASLTSVWRALHGYNNPQIFYQYTRPVPGAAPDIQHMREYTAYELRDAVRAAGFEVETLLTEPIEKFSEHLPVWNFLEENGFNTAYRGEQTYCVAVKRAGAPDHPLPNVPLLRRRLISYCNPSRHDV